MTLEVSVMASSLTNSRSPTVIPSFQGRNSIVDFMQRACSKYRLISVSFVFSLLELFYLVLTLFFDRGPHHAKQNGAGM